jgi:hypothetical protein
MLEIAAAHAGVLLLELSLVANRAGLHVFDGGGAALKPYRSSASAPRPFPGILKIAIHWSGSARYEFMASISSVRGETCRRADRS